MGCNIYEDKLPIDYATTEIANEFEMDPTICALSGGEDYELLFTIEQSDFEKVKDLQEISIIGNITDASAGVNLISRSGTQVPITAQGWDAFLKSKK